MEAGGTFEVINGHLENSSETKVKVETTVQIYFSLEREPEKWDNSQEIKGAFITF